MVGLIPSLLSAVAVTATPVAGPVILHHPAVQGPVALRAAQEPVALIEEGRQLVNAGVNRNETDLIEQGRAVFERLLAAPGYEALAHYYAGLAEYRLTNLSWESGRRSVRQHVGAAIDHLEEAVAIDPDFADAHALLSGAYGLKIAVNPLTGMTLGPKNQRARERARELAPDNPRVVLLDAISYFNTPGAFGGDKEKALELAHRAAELFAGEEIVDPKLPTWGREEVYAWIGMIQADAGKIDLARAAYEKALEINPEYGWVEYYLLPSLSPPPMDRSD